MDFETLHLIASFLIIGDFLYKYGKFVINVTKELVKLFKKEDKRDI